MSRSVVLGLALLAGVSFLLFVWSAPAERGAGEHVERVASRSQPAQPLVLSSPPAGVVEGSEDNSTAAVQRRTPLGSRISGIVKLSHAFPKNEHVRVWADVRAAGSNLPQSYRSASMSRDGSFSVTVPDAASHVILDIESRLLDLPNEVVARPGQTDVVLEPEARWLIEGVVVPPLSVSTSGFSWVQMEVSWSIDPDLKVSSHDNSDETNNPSYVNPVCPDEDGAFVLDVPVGIELELQAKNPFGPVWSRSIEPLVPGERRVVEIALELGATISGRVIDELGRPVEGVEIQTTDDELRGHLLKGPAWNQKTDANGAFEFTGQSRRVTKVMIGRRDLARGAETTVDTTVGDVRGLLLEVVRGGCIEGLVLWPSRSPVARFEVSASGVDGHAGAEIGEAGRFHLCGLAEDTYRVDVHATGFDVVGTASVLGVRSGSAPLQLILEETPTFEVRGVVVDGKDEGIRRFEIRATRRNPAFPRQSTVGYSGRFVLGRLEPGEWTIEVSAVGHQPVQQRVLVGVEPSVPLRFVLLPADRTRERGAGRSRER